MSDRPQNESKEQAQGNVGEQPPQEVPMPRDDDAQAQNQKQKKKKKEDDGQRKWYAIFATILIIIIIILLLLLLRQCSSDVPTLNPDYPPKEQDPNAEIIPGDDDDKLAHEEGGGAVSLQYSDKLIIDLSDEQALLQFANPGRSTRDMVLWITIQDVVIAQSGRIIPGYRINTLDLLEGAAKRLTEGVYNGKLVIYFYNPETNERTTVNTEAPVTITVRQ
ncbi:MAG: hypothetical protein IJW40_10995 [Clostridia bacterium]|nr:hypothetical protein [Clostridia bacterium]